MAASSIGAFDFVSMLPPPSFPFAGMEFEARAGVNGYAAWKTGYAADRFSVTTVRDVVNFAAATVLFANYQTLVGANPQTIYYGGGQLPFYVLVEKVEPEEIRQVVLGVGGINGVSRGLVRAKWMLIPWVLP